MNASQGASRGLLLQPEPPLLFLPGQEHLAAVSREVQGPDRERGEDQADDQQDA